MLETPLAKAFRTTSQHLRRLKELGVETVKDFLLYFPHRYTDQREVLRIIDIQLDQINTIRGILKTIKNTAMWKRRMNITKGLVSDSTGTVEMVWFNQPYLARTLQPNTEVIVSGKAKYDAKRGTIVFQNPAIEAVKEAQVHTARIVPVYHETELGNTPRSGALRRTRRLSSKWIREKLFSLLPFAKQFPEFLPASVVKKYGLMAFSEAVANAHFPSSETSLDAAKHRLAFNELFILQLAAFYRRYVWRSAATKNQKQITPNWELMKEFTSSLPWPITAGQKKAIYEILTDAEKPFPLSRLLEGDTGSGKTVVAAAVALQVIRAGFQVCLLAPTEILARQHLKTFSKLLAPFAIKPILLVGSTLQKEKRNITIDLSQGLIQCIIGTHSVIQKSVHFSNLGLAIIDEQHRFGVKQRELLKSYGSPHLLSLTATPIPRTLALILYGDQDLSILDEMPPGRHTIVTRIVPEEKRRECYQWIEQEIKKDRQAFIIFPLIEESEKLQVKAATKEWERLATKVFPRLRVRLLHGQMPARNKELIMQEFAAGKSDILVSTAVVEVGVDVPKATIMMIEGAERFGLAQLHQFRGRVGRGSEQSYCFLFPSFETPQTMKRLQALVKHNSGFKLAEIDLQLRGPGEVFGIAQSGIPDLKMATLTDASTIKQARECAEMIIEEDPKVEKYPELLKKITEQENIAIDY